MTGRSASRKGRRSLGLGEVRGWELVDVILEKFPLLPLQYEVPDRDMEFSCRGWGMGGGRRLCWSVLCLVHIISLNHISPTE